MMLYQAWRPWHLILIDNIDLQTFINWGRGFHRFEREGDTRPLHQLWALAKNTENVAIFLPFHFQFYSLFQEKCATLCCHLQTKHFKRISKFRCLYYHLGKSILFYISNSKAQILHFSFLYHFLKKFHPSFAAIHATLFRPSMQAILIIDAMILISSIKILLSYIPKN